MRTFFKIVACGIASVIWTSALSAQEENTPQIDKALAAEGKTLVKKHCAKCHAIGKTGESPFAPAPNFRVWVKNGEPEHLAEAFAEGILVGHDAMPVFRFEPSQIGALIEHLKKLKAETN